VVVSKFVSPKAGFFISHFIEIPYLQRNELYDIHHQELLSANRRLVVAHSTWFISAALHGTIDTIKYDKRDREARQSCQCLHCPLGCSQKISFHQRLLLLTLRDPKSLMVRRKAEKEILTSLELLTILPFMIYESDLTIELSEAILSNRQAILSVFYLLYNYRTMTEEYKRFSVMLMGGMTPSMLNEFYRLLPSIESLEQLVYDIEGYADLVKNKVFELGESIVIPEKISRMRVMTHKPRLNAKSPVVLLETNGTNTYAYVETLSVVEYTFNACLMALCTVDELAMDLPYAFYIPFSSGRGLYRIDGKVDLDLSDLYKRYNAVRPLSIFVVLCYLFGLYDVFPLVTDRGLVLLGLGSFYEQKELPVSDIIYSLGGRLSDSYERFYQEAIRLLHIFRRQYVLITTYLSILKIRRELIDERFMPRGTDAQAEVAFTKMLRESANRAMGWWKYIGY